MPSGQTTRERDQQAQIAGFVRRFLASSGATVEACGHVLTARLPRELAERLGTGDRLSLTFNAEAMDDRPGGDGAPTGAEFVTFGHPLLDKMLELAKDRGLASSFLFAPALEPEFVRFALTFSKFGSDDDAAAPSRGATQSLWRTLRGIQFANAKAHVRSSRLVHQTQVLFKFKVALISDEKRESIVTLLVDPVTESVDRPVDLQGAVSFTPQVGAAIGERNSYAISRLYRRAQECLHQRIGPIARAFEAEAAARMERELNRIEEYYRGLFEERLESVRSVFRRVSAAGMRAGLARTWQTHERYREQVGKLRIEADELERLFKTELQELSRERERQTQELKEKHQTRVEVSLLQAAYVMVPRFEWSVRLEGPRRRDVVLLYDVLRRQSVDFACECCDAPFLGNVYLCGCELLACEECHSRCSRCGSDQCRLCAPALCHVCRRPVCAACDTSCPLGGVFIELELPRICTDCRESSCSICIPLSAPHAF